MPEQHGFDLRMKQGLVDDRGYYRPSDYELATGWVCGFDSPTLPSDLSVNTSPRAAFEAALLPALQRSPCVVAFSGGRDSSAILAVATHLARRHGLADPVAATHDFAGHAHADEARFQELVISDLKLREWYRFRDAEGCDVLGERARRGLRTHGLLWPAMVHGHAPMVELAAGGGSIVTGEGGDEILGEQRITTVRHAIRNRRPSRRTARMLVDSLAPKAERRRSLRRQLRAVGMHPWLRRDVAEDFVERLARDLADGPLRWDAAVLRHSGRRCVTMTALNFRRIFAADDVSYHEPFLEPGFLQAIGRAGGWSGWLTRTSMMRMLFSDVLPDEICRRNEKAEFGGVAVGESSRAFLAGWSGEGLDSDVVDIEAFRREVQRENPLFGVQMLLQTAWLTTARRRPPVASETP